MELKGFLKPIKINITKILIIINNKNHFYTLINKNY